MTDTDGLFLDNQWIMPADSIASTFQSNDLTKPTTLQSSHTNTFSIPDSVAVRKLTGNAEQLDSGSRWPYRTISARVTVRGETIFSGFAEFEQYSDGWEITLFQEKKNLFDRLDRSIRTAQLQRYDHVWSLEVINSLSVATEGVCYPLVDYGLLSDGSLPSDTLFPALFVKTLLAELFYEEGYTLVGQLPTDELFNRLVIPFVESEPTNHDEQWKLDRQARVTWNRPTDTIDKGTLGRRYFLDRVQEFNVDNLIEQGFQQGVLHNYNTNTYSFVCDSAMRVRVQAYQAFKGLCLTGAIEAELSVTKNGQTVDTARFEGSAPYNLIFITQAELKLDTTISCKAGDRLQIRLMAQRQTSIGAFRFEMYNDPERSWASYTPDLTTQTNDYWPVARNLPDMTGLMLLKSLAYLMGGTWSVDAFRHQIAFVSFSNIVHKIAQAVDWSNRINTGVRPVWTPRLDPYARVNYLTWKESEQSKNQPVIAPGLPKGSTLNYGDGFIEVNAETLDPNTTLFEMPFAASTDSANELPGYGKPVLIKTRSVSGYGDTLSITKESTPPRLLLVSLGDTQAIQAKRLKADSVTPESVTVNLKPAWFGVRPDRAISAETRYCLSFSPLAITRGETCLIDRYYDGLMRVLRRIHVLTVSLTLTPKDIAGLDFERPVTLQRVQVGGLQLSTHFFYINKISDHVDGQPCQVTLIAF